VRALWSLPKAAPAVLRHLVAYAELAALDLARARREVGAIFIALAVAAVCGVFCLSLGCLAVIAYFWDTPYRVAAIGCLAGGFLFVAVIMLIYSKRLARARTPFLSDLGREWQEDRVILEHALSADEE
jgi:uncharacterized membrane protein YqjE